MRPLVDIFPILHWLKGYQKDTLANDLMAGIIVAIMLVPQGMAYALLAGLPAEYGLYASILPLLIYSMLGSSRTLAVGPVAIASLMVSTSISQVAEPGSTAYLNAAINLSFLVGIILLFLRSLQIGSIVNFISHSVLSGFTSAAALIIAISQLKHLFGLEMPNGLRPDQNIDFILSNLTNSNTHTLFIAALSLLVLWYSRCKLCNWLDKAHFPQWVAKPICKAGPMFAVLLGSLLVWFLSLDTESGVATVGMIPEGLPSLQLIHIDLALWKELFTPALLIALIGFLESVSVGTALASKRKERIDPNKELVALGAANLGAAFSGTYPVAGGFGRSMVNNSAGAQTTVASAITAIIVAITVAFFTPLFYYLPKAALGAIIILAVLPLIDFNSFRQCWRFNKADAMTLLATFFLVLAFGVELGILSGIAISVILLLYRSSQPHIAIVGRVGETEQFRNIDRHNVSTSNDTLALRVDESLYFANTRFVEDYILEQCSEQPQLKHVVLICTAVNFIDASALETLESLVHNLQGEGVILHLSDVKGPVMDQLASTNFLNALGEGKIFFTTDAAMRELAGI